MLILWEATANDLDFLVEVDLKDEGCSSIYRGSWEQEEYARHRDEIATFISGVNKAAWVCEDTGTGTLVGMMLWRYRNRRSETFEAWSVFSQLDEGLFPPDGAFCEIFQLWVAPKYRRQGLASRLKRQSEVESLRRGVRALYTRTEARNTPVIEMNLKLGYREVRRGPIWDEVVRVSLIKTLS